MRLRLSLALLALGAAGASAQPHKKARPRTAAKHATPHVSRFESPDDSTSTPAYRYARMTQDECEAELTARKIAFQRETAKGVLAPVRLTGPLHGVTFKTELSDTQRETTPWEIGDCRLILAMDDFAAILEKHDIVEVHHYSMYRSVSKNWPDGKIASRHNGALALDAAKFISKDGKKLSVLDDFHGAIGAKTCGDGATPRKPTPEATELRTILCDTVAAHLFNVVLTPNYNRPHRNHFHLEVTAGVSWFLVH